MHCRNATAEYITTDPREATEQKLLLQWIDQYPQTILLRENSFAHMTASAMIFNPSMTKTLMVYHKIYDSWSWTGGHADGEADMMQVALREAQEETGLIRLSPITDRPTGLDILPVKGHFKKGSWIPAHIHLSLCYSFFADEDQTLRCKPDENSGVRWIKIDDLQDFVSEPDMLPIYERIIRRTRTHL